MPNFQSAPLTNAAVQINFNITPVQTDMYSPDTGWLLGFPDLRHAVDYMRDHVTPNNATGTAHQYLVTLQYFVNNAGPWSEQGAAS